MALLDFVSNLDRGTAIVLIASIFVIVRTLISLFTPNPPPFQPTPPEPEMTRPVSQSELAEATGGEGKSLFIAMQDPYGDKVTVFDVSAGSDFYGPGGPYHVFVGKNATHGLATSSTDPSTVTGDISGLTAQQKDTHMQWYMKYSAKYRIVGHLVDDGAPAENGTAAEESKKDA